MPVTGEHRKHAARIVEELGYTGEKAEEAKKRLARLLSKAPTQEELKSLVDYIKSQRGNNQSVWG